MLQKKKFLATGFLILTILIVIFLVSGISGVNFQPGINIPKESDQTEPVTFELPVISTPIWYCMLMFFIWVGLPISVILFIINPNVRKRTLQSLGYLAIYGLVLFLLSRKTQEVSSELENIETELIDTNIIDTQRQAADFISSMTEADPNLNIILDSTILILVGILVWVIYRRFFSKPPTSTDQIKVEVKGAIHEIESGVDLRNVIIRCYADMSQILLDRRGIQRQQAMTIHSP